jgi:hypothetical protein
MALPRSQYVQEGQEGFFHCYNRCVRRAFLCGSDSVTGQDFSHRKEWLVAQLQFLASIFAIDVCAFAILANHFHVILHTLPKLIAGWSDWEVATRWLTLFPKRHRNKPNSLSPLEEDIRALADNSERIATLRQRLSSISWFMAKLDEYIARAANKEDNAKGRFWESRFKCRTLLDEAGLCSCMVYVDLNPIRAALAASPEDSDFTSIQLRIQDWLSQLKQTLSDAKTANQSAPASLTCNNTDPVAIAKTPSVENLPPKNMGLWLCPISSNSSSRGILSMTEAEYIDLVDRSGLMIIAGKRGYIDADLAPILQRININPNVWDETISRFGSSFHVAAGSISNMRSFARRIGRRWLSGVSAARSAFASSPPNRT